MTYARNEQVAQWIEATMAAVTTAAGFNYQPQLVARIDEPHPSLLTRDYSCLYFLSPGQEIAREETGAIKEYVADFYLLGGVRMDTSREATPWARTGKTRWQVQNELWRDMQVALNAWPSAGYIENLEAADRQLMYSENWALVEARLTAKWSAPKTAP